jgi:hypothetical protein
MSPRSADSLLQPLATEDGGDRGPAERDVAASALMIDWGSCYVPTAQEHGGQRPKNKADIIAGVACRINRKPDDIPF